MSEVTERKKLIEYLPTFMQQFPEMQEIMKTQNVETDILNKNIFEVLDNAFIEECNEYGIKKYENILGIIPTAEDTLGSRKIRVLNRWNDTLPYTYRVLIRRLNILCGVNNYDISGELKRYELFITTDLPEQGAIDELSIMIDSIIPVNMFVKSDNKMRRGTKNVRYVGGTVISTRFRTILKAVRYEKSDSNR